MAIKTKLTANKTLDGERQKESFFRLCPKVNFSIKNAYDQACLFFKKWYTNIVLVGVSPFRLHSSRIISRRASTIKTLLEIRVFLFIFNLF